MNYQVVYFSRTGNSKRVALKISEALHAPIIEINDHKNWRGLIGYIRAGYYSTVDKKVKIILSQPLDNNLKTILVTPLWAGGIAPAARAFIRSHDKKDIHLVVTSIGSTLKDKKDYMSITDIIKREAHEDEVIEKFIDALNTKKDV